MARETRVYVDIHGQPELAGRLWFRARGGRESATFEYASTWLERPDRFSFDPTLTLDTGPHHTPAGKALFGGIGDSAPDRWGRTLMRRAERRNAHAQGRTLTELDYLLQVNDEARQGALRFAETQGGAFLTETGDDPIPPMLALPQLLNASERVLEDEDDTGASLRLLLAPGSSLGGARPKASVRDGSGRLALAKFPQKNDETQVVCWEAVALTLAARAGIEVPAWRIEPVGDQVVLIAERFDRDDGQRIPFLSAMSMLGASDRETRSYLEIVDAIRRHGATPAADIKALWRRVVFNVLISNTDDHLRNHGFLYSGEHGWRLSPAYDLNPVPADIKPRFLSTTIDLDDNTASLSLALQVADYFELSRDEARGVAREVAEAVTGWRHAAASLSIASSEIRRMESAFQHQDLEDALSG